MPQAKQTQEEIRKTLLELLKDDESQRHSRGDNVVLDDDDERVLDDIYPAAEQLTIEDSADE